MMSHCGGIGPEYLVARPRRAPWMKLNGAMVMSEAIRQSRELMEAGLDTCPVLDIASSTFQVEDCSWFGTRLDMLSVRLVGKD